jgi:hypothetical protein
MNSLIVPLHPVPSQTVSVSLNNQACQVNVYALGSAPYEHLFCDLYVSDALIIGGVICQNLNLIVRDAYLGFIGDLMFQDTQGADDPVYSGLGARWILNYVFPP